MICCWLLFGTLFWWEPIRHFYATGVPFKDKNCIGLKRKIDPMSREHALCHHFCTTDTVVAALTFSWNDANYLSFWRCLFFDTAQRKKEKWVLPSTVFFGPCNKKKAVVVFGRPLLVLRKKGGRVLNGAFNSSFFGRMRSVKRCFLLRHCVAFWRGEELMPRCSVAEKG